MGCSPRTATFVGCPTFRAGARGVSMTRMNQLRRLPTSVRRSPNGAAGPSYTFAAVVAAGALAATALLNRHLAKKAEHAQSASRAVPGSRRCPAALRGTRLRRAVGASAWQRQHDPGLRIQRIGRPGRQELQGHHHRPPRFRPQQPATERHLDARCPGPVDPARARSSRCFTGHRTRALLGSVGRSRSCSQVPRLRARSGARLRLLLSHPASGRRCHVSPGNPRCGRCHGPHGLAHDQQDDMAA